MSKNTDDIAVEEFEECLNRILDDLRAHGRSLDQIVSVFKTFAERFVIDTMERIEKVQGRKLSDKEIKEISDTANSVFVKPIIRSLEMCADSDRTSNCF